MIYARSQRCTQGSHDLQKGLMMHEKIPYYAKRSHDIRKDLMIVYKNFMCTKNITIFFTKVFFAHSIIVYKKLILKDHYVAPYPVKMHRSSQK